MNEAIVLVGGLAKRLGSLSLSTPKCLQPVAGVPFIDHLLWNVARHGIRRIVLATGWLHEEVEAHVGDGSKYGVEVVYSRETEPLGTGGAVSLAATHLRGEDVLVLNGDSLVDCNYLDLALFRRHSGADVALALRAVDDASRFGAVQVDDAGRITEFGEKMTSGRALVNAGVYVATAASLRSRSDKAFSLEKDSFPTLMAAGRLAGKAYDGFFVDIGLPESLLEAQTSVEAWRNKPCAFLDRDGVMNREVDYAHHPDDFAWMPGMPAAVKLLNDAGWLVVVITNQAGIGRGYYTEQQFADFTAWIDLELARAGAHVDATYWCPHHPTDAKGDYLKQCSCRKPAPGMLLKAIADWQPDLERSLMIGDKPSDMAAAEAAGLRGILYTGGDIAELARALVSEAAPRP